MSENKENAFTKHDLIRFREAAGRFLQVTFAGLQHCSSTYGQQEKWFIHDDIPHNYFRTVHTHLKATYLGRWNDPKGEISLPPPSPKINFLDFSSWSPEITH